MAMMKGMKMGDGNNNTGAGNSNNTSSDNKSDDVVAVPPAGFIFLCNKKTKPRCFLYQVFGLSETQMKIVEKIKPGMKLFLFDYELKVLHGVYESVSEGKLDPESRAFNGKYLAQVKFRTVRECLPVEEKYFKNILDNYGDGRLKLELTEQQVNRLMPLFYSVPEQGETGKRTMTMPNAAASSPHPRSRQILPQNPSPPPPPPPPQHHQHTVADAIVDHALQHYNIHNPIAHLPHDPYSTVAHTLVSVQQPYPPRHILEQEWIHQQNQIMAMQANDYLLLHQQQQQQFDYLLHHQQPQQLPLMGIQTPETIIHYSPHHHPITTWYHHPHPLPPPYLLTENLNPANSFITATNPNNINPLSTIHPPPTYGFPAELHYGFPAELHYGFPAELHYGFPAELHYGFPAIPHPPPPPSPLLSYAGNWIEPPNPTPIISGIPVNVPISALFSFPGENHQFIN